MLDVRNNWISQKIGGLSDKDLSDVFEEIYYFRDTGILEGHCLRGLEEEIAKVTKTRGGDMLRHVEDDVLFEMARRYYNGFSQD